MKILTIGDVHCSSHWVEPVNYALNHFIDYTLSKLGKKVCKEVSKI